MTIVVNKKVAKLLACLTILMFLFTLSGCLTKAVDGDKEGAIDQEQETDVVELVDVDEQDAAGEGQEEITETTEPAEPTETAIPAKKVKVTLYFSDESGQKLIAETREISFVEGLARATMEELAKGPTTSGAKATLPEGTKLLDINIKADGLGIVDFSRELKQKHAGGSTAELLTVYSIVNTFAQFDTVDRVQIFVGGQKIESLVDHVKISEPLVPDASLIK